MAKLQEFYLLRTKDVSGVSGVGLVARGVILSSHRVVMEWQMPYETLTVFDNIGQVQAIHGHGGSTKLVMGTPPKKLLEKK
ncbi:MAG: hypothetical protein HC836_45295 [Richelia sp. RM2_1_2]|nr:hypothetical protein [Richelia sp. RM2_1_2]